MVENCTRQKKLHGAIISSSSAIVISHRMAEGTTKCPIDRVGLCFFFFFFYFFFFRLFFFFFFFVLYFFSSFFFFRFVCFFFFFFFFFRFLFIYWFIVFFFFAFFRFCLYLFFLLHVHEKQLWSVNRTTLVLVTCLTSTKCTYSPQ